MKIKPKVKKYVLISLVVLIVLMNLVAYFHAYKFTHFAKELAVKTNSPEKLSILQKIKTLAFGVNNPRPQNKITPSVPYETIKLKSDKEIECWLIPVKNSKGTVVIFHGYSGNKASMLENSDTFNGLGYSTLLVDFRGSGGSEGNQTTLGFHEALDVEAAFNYLVQARENNIILFGTSMGAAAIMKAVKDFQLLPQGLILECPFGTMLQTVEARFRIMKVPPFPMANLLVLWGGIQNGFNAFKLNPDQYAEGISIPTLLMYGAKDPDVSMQETRKIFNNLRGKKKLKIFDNAGHESYLHMYRNQWIETVSDFLNIKTKQEH